MKEKVISLLAGFGLSFAIIALAIYFISRPPKIEVNSSEPFDQSKLQQVQDNTRGLQNYGNLPKQVDNASSGRSNPFDDYK
jgi:hypothetical protein